MPLQFNDDVIGEIDKKLGDLSFLTLPQLKELGVFGSLSAIRRVLREGKLTFVRVSPRRCLIPKSSILKYLHKHLSNSTHK